MKKRGEYSTTDFQFLSLGNAIHLVPIGMTLLSFEILDTKELSS